MTEKKRRPAKKRGGPVNKSPYFLQPAKQGSVTVLRRPAGNRIDAKLCGTMANRLMALALVKQLEKAESVVKDLFLEATDDGIEALDAVLEACRQSVMRRGDSAEGGQPSSPGAGARKRGRSRRKGSAPRPPGDRRRLQTAPKTRAPPDGAEPFARLHGAGRRADRARRGARSLHSAVFRPLHALRFLRRRMLPARRRCFHRGTRADIITRR